MSYVVVNSINVPGGAGPELEKRFAARAGEVDEQPGFEGFELLRPADGRDAYFVVTHWDSRESFEGWMSSSAFGRGHGQSAGGGPVGTGSEVLAFEVVDLG